MKQITLSLFLLVFFSCKVTKPIPEPEPESKHYPRTVHFFAFDFTPFTEQGFLFTPEKYNFDYESIGLMTCVVIPEEQSEVIQLGEQQVNDEQKEILDDIYFNNNNNESTTKTRLMFFSEEINPDEVLELIFDECVERGADAFVNFEYRTQFLRSPNTFKEVKYHIVSGFAIKRVK